MLFRGPYLKIRTWKQSLLQLIQEVKNHVEMYRPSNTGGDIPAARVVTIIADAEVAMADAGGVYDYADGVTEEVIPTGSRGRVRNTGFVRVQLVPAQVPVAGLPVQVSLTPGFGTLETDEGKMFGRVYDMTSYAADETVIVRLTCCSGFVVA